MTLAHPSDGCPERLDAVQMPDKTRTHFFHRFTPFLNLTQFCLCRLQIRLCRLQICLCRLQSPLDCIQSAENPADNVLRLAPCASRLLPLPTLLLSLDGLEFQTHLCGHRGGEELFQLLVTSQAESSVRGCADHLGLLGGRRTEAPCALARILLKSSIPCIRNRPMDHQLGPVYTHFHRTAFAKWRRVRRWRLLCGRAAAFGW